jgi:hypothetical protein
VFILIAAEMQKREDEQTLITTPSKGRKLESDRPESKLGNNY